MAETVDEITIEWRDENGELLVKEIDKEVLTKGAWSTIMFRFQELDRKTGQYGAFKIRVGRYKKVRGQYISQSKFTMSSKAQALQIAAVIDKWCNEPEGE